MKKPTTRRVKGNLKKSKMASMKKIKQVLKDEGKSEQSYQFVPWIPKNKKNKVPLRFYVANSKAYITKFKDKMIIHSDETSEQLRIKYFLLKQNIDLESISKLSDLNEELENNQLIFENKNDKNPVTHIKLQAITYERTESLDKTLVKIIDAVISSGSGFQAVSEGIIAASNEAIRFEEKK